MPLLTARQIAELLIPTRSVMQLTQFISRPLGVVSIEGDRFTKGNKRVDWTKSTLGKPKESKKDIVQRMFGDKIYKLPIPGYAADIAADQQPSFDQLWQAIIYKDRLFQKKLGLSKGTIAKGEKLDNEHGKDKIFIGTT